MARIYHPGKVPFADGPNHIQQLPKRYQRWLDLATVYRLSHELPRILRDDVTSTSM